MSDDLVWEYLCVRGTILYLEYLPIIYIYIISNDRGDDIGLSLRVNRFVGFCEFAAAVETNGKLAAGET